MSTRYNSNYDLTVPFSDDSAQLHLTSGSALTYTVPGSANNTYSVRFSYNSDASIFVRKNAAPTIPGADTINTEQFNEYKPGADGTQRYVIGGDVLHFETTDAAAYCGISVRKIN